MGPEVIAIMSAIQGLIAVAPQVEAFVEKTKKWITDMFESGLISADDQNTLNARVDEICRATLAGEEPPAWQVEPDPTS